MRKITVILLIAVCPLALAELVPVGDPEGGGSWEQRFLEISSAPIDLIGVCMVSAGTAFKSPAYNDFNDASWSILLDGDVIASARGNDLDTLEWNLHFDGSMDDPLVFDYYAFAGNELVSSARCSWVEGAAACQWFIDPGATNDPPVLIPAPGAALLGAVGLLCLRWVRRHTG